MLVPLLLAACAGYDSDVGASGDAGIAVCDYSAQAVASGIPGCPVIVAVTCRNRTAPSIQIYDLRNQYMRSSEPCGMTGAIIDTRLRLIIFISGQSRKRTPTADQSRRAWPRRGICCYQRRLPPRCAGPASCTSRSETNHSSSRCHQTV